MACAATYILVWTLFPVWLAASFPLDVVESLSWGREWQWGYYKHPPLAPSVLHVFHALFGKVGPFLLSQLCIAATLWLVWRTGLRLMAPQRAWVGALLTMGVAYYSLPSLEFNHNIAQMPVWAALGYCLLRALQEGRWQQWLLLGVVAGLGLLTKYSVGILLASFGLYIVLTPERRVLLRPGPWLALAAMALVFLPHLVWLWRSDWLPFAYAGMRASAEAGSPRKAAVGFVATQALNHLPLAVAAAVALWGARRASPAAGAGGWRLQTAQPRFLLMLAVGPGLLVTLLGLTAGLRLRDMWGSPMWAFSGLLLAAAVPEAWWPAARPRLLRGLAVWLCLVTLLVSGYLAFGAKLRHRPSRMDWPAQVLGQHVQATWAQQSRCRLDVVAGSTWLSGLIATQSASGPSVLVDGDPRYSPWVTRERLQAHGALWVWEPDRQETATAVPPQPLDGVDVGASLRTQEGQWQIPWPHDPKGAPWTIRWRSYVPASCVDNSGGNSHHDPIAH